MGIRDMILDAGWTTCYYKLAVMEQRKETTQGNFTWAME